MRGHHVLQQFPRRCVAGHADARAEADVGHALEHLGIGQFAQLATDVQARREQLIPA